MSFFDAFVLIFYSLAGAGLFAWYLWCWKTMLFDCQRPSHFFCEAYSTSGPFMVVNIIAVLSMAAQVIVWLTN